MSQRLLNRFGVVLDLLIASRYTSARALLHAIGEPVTYKKVGLIRNWRQGTTYPRYGRHIRVAQKIEKHFELEEGRLTTMIRGTSSTLFDHLKNKNPHYIQMTREHLPEDFDIRSEQEKGEILDWISANVLVGTTEYRKYLARVTHHKFAIVFPSAPRGLGGGGWVRRRSKKPRDYRTIPAPTQLEGEVDNLLKFKTDALPPKGYQRRGRWQETTAKSQLKRYGVALGLFAAARDGELKGLGISLSDLTLGLFVFPELWEWYLTWYLRRRGFFSSQEINVLYELKSHTRNPTGWVRQHPELAKRLRPVPGIIPARDINWAQAHWDQACTRTFEYAAQRISELSPVARMHRDPFEAIMPVLTAKSPLRAYKKIGDEILRRMPDENKRPRAAASAVRSYLMFRFAVHLGIRQRNLRELLVCPPGAKCRDVCELEKSRHGELRWNPRQRTWEVFIPAVAIKNGKSSFFKWRPLKMTLPDREDLYLWIARYLKKHRDVLLNGRADTGSFFVRTMIGPYQNPEFDIHSFYNQWKGMIQRYGIYNPYTKRGAIEGLLPHGPHAVRDILATHLLKTTGSYELASFAIQANLEAVMEHYARFLPHEKVARAAKELNKVWKD